MKNKKIIECQVLEINDGHLVLKSEESNYVCHKSEISDYEVDLKNFFRIGNSYKFLVTENDNISYKKIRPKLLRNKKKPIPTISRHYNLEKKLLMELSREKDDK